MNGYRWKDHLGTAQAATNAMIKRLAMADNETDAAWESAIHNQRRAEKAEKENELLKAENERLRNLNAEMLEVLQRAWDMLKRHPAWRVARDTEIGPSTEASDNSADPQGPMERPYGSEKF